MNIVITKNERPWLITRVDFVDTKFVIDIVNRKYPNQFTHRGCNIKGVYFEEISTGNFVFFDVFPVDFCEL